MERDATEQLLSAFVDLIADHPGSLNSYSKLQPAEESRRPEPGTKHNQKKRSREKVAAKQCHKERNEHVNFLNLRPTLRSMKRRSGTGCLYLRGQIWWAKYVDGGVTHYESTKSVDRAKAEAILDARLGHRKAIQDADPLTKTLARRVVRDALRKDSSLRPSRCSACGKTCKPEAHHEDYSRALDVIWLCSRCHGVADVIRRLRLVGRSA